MPNIEPFDKNYLQYEDWFARNKYAYESEIKAVKSFIPDNKLGIEIGIGSGIFAARLGVNTGVEPSSAMRRLAEKRGLTVYDGVAENLPVESGSIDFALMITTICFVDDICKSFNEVHRILKNDGLFIIGFVDEKSPLGQKYNKNKYENVFYRNATFYSCEQVLKILRETNFNVIEIIQTVFGNPGEINQIQEYKAGYGEGGFVVIRAEKNKN